MTNSPNNAKGEGHDGFAAGVVLGTLLGGVSLFFFQTKTGKKVHDRLIAELDNGDFDFDSIKNATNTKLEEFLAGTKIIDYVEEAFAKQKDKTGSAKTNPTKSSKNFFFKKGKKLKAA